jgi:hypothetical protein
VPQQGVFTFRRGREVGRAVDDAVAGDEHSSNCKCVHRQGPAASLSLSGAINRCYR